MRILHVLGGDPAGGAARAAFRIHGALARRHVDSRMLVMHAGPAQRPDETLEALAPGKLGRLRALCHRQLDQLALQVHGGSRRHFDPALTGFAIDHGGAYAWADLVHLHYVNDGMLSLHALGRIRKPTVWTLHDMWPFTGGCHNALDCDHYRERCGSCPALLRPHAWDASRLLLQAKRRYRPPQLSPVAVSHWLAACAQQSAVLRDLPVSVIHNGIDVTRFSPVEPGAARRLLGLPPSQPIVLAGAVDHGQPTKGFDLLCKALSRLALPRLTVAIFGRIPHAPVLAPGHDLVELGVLRDDLSLRLAYAAADVFVAASRQETFGNTLAEAMACGTPVVCFDESGPRDIVAHRQTGYRASPFDAADLAAGIAWTLADRERKGRLGEAARARAMAHFDIEECADRYRALYRDVLTATAAPRGRVGRDA